jgi:hypothetical protein
MPIAIIISRFFTAYMVRKIAFSSLLLEDAKAAVQPSLV